MLRSWFHKAGAYFTSRPRAWLVLVGLVLFALVLVAVLQGAHLSLGSRGARRAEFIAYILLPLLVVGIIYDVSKWKR